MVNQRDGKGSESRVYTRSGDEGQTSLLGGRRVSKSSVRVEAYGTVDELISFAGLAAAEAARFSAVKAMIGDSLVSIQDQLMRVAATVAAQDPKARQALAPIPTDAAERLESDIDSMSHSLDPLKSFILPGGSRLAALLHVCRTVCRRAERRIVDLVAGVPEGVPAEVLPYINRLADWFFTAARYANFKLGAKESKWKTGRVASTRG